MDDKILLGMLVVFCAVTIVLLIRVEWRDWGLVGLMFLCAGVSAVLLRANLPRWGIDEGSRELIWLWRAGALLGGSIVLTGMGIELYRSTPSWTRILRRLAIGAIAAIVIVATLRAWFWAV